jgi:protein TonB
MVTTTTPHATMFGGYQQAQIRKLPPWALPLLGGCFMFVFAILGAMWVKTIWALDQVDLPKSSIDLAIAPSPPPPPPPPPGSSKPHDVQLTPKKKTVKDLVQPNIKVEKQEVQQSADVGDPNGEVGGEEGGVAGGVVGGVAGPPPPPPPPPPPAPPQNVPPTMLEGSRIAGDKMIAPDDVTKTEIGRSGKDRIVGSYKLCLTLDGSISSVAQLKSTGFPAYDAKIQGKMRSEWRYKPYNVNGKPVPVCTAVTFIYSQK